MTTRTLQSRIRQLKAASPEGELLLVRMGDFYEAFDEDARTLARVLGLTLTTRHRKGEPEWPMTGFPCHQFDGYIGKLVAEGHRVLCETLVGC